MKKLTIIILSIFFLSLTGCGSQEEKARELYNKALVLQRAGDSEKATEIYSNIVTKYPSTEIAVKVNEMLAGKELVEDALSGVKKEISKEGLSTALKMYKLDNGSYPTTEQGINALVEKPTTGYVPVNWRPSGYLENPESIKYVKSYTLSADGRTFKITMK